MAEGFTIRCDHCDYDIEVWSDSHSYYYDSNGKKRYAHHPSSKLEQCVGCETDFICLGCGHKFRSDSEKPRDSCPKCRKNNIDTRWNAAGKTCPYCKIGTFREDPASYKIS